MLYVLSIALHIHYRVKQNSSLLGLIMSIKSFAILPEKIRNAQPITVEGNWEKCGSRFYFHLWTLLQT